MVIFAVLGDQRMTKKDRQIAILASFAVVAAIVSFSYWNEGYNMKRGPFGIPLHETSEMR